MEENNLSIEKFNILVKQEFHNLRVQLQNEETVSVFILAKLKEIRSLLNDKTISIDQIIHIKEDTDDVNFRKNFVNVLIPTFSPTIINYGDNVAKFVGGNGLSNFIFRLSRSRLSIILPQVTLFFLATLVLCSFIVYSNNMIITFSSVLLCFSMTVLILMGLLLSNQFILKKVLCTFDFWFIVVNIMIGLTGVCLTLKNNFQKSIIVYIGLFVAIPSLIIGEAHPSQGRIGYIYPVGFVLNCVILFLMLRFQHENMYTEDFHFRFLGVSISVYNRMISAVFNVNAYYFYFSLIQIKSKKNDSNLIFLCHTKNMKISKEEALERTKKLSTQKSYSLGEKSFTEKRRKPKRVFNLNEVSDRSIHLIRTINNLILTGHKSGISDKYLKDVLISEINELIIQRSSSNSANDSYICSGVYERGQG